ncbi:hypothetical protein [Paraburkholderia bannensis]|uniref:hypothetical protein n=1 Tax=Paraburkholderia bannensis TaxID=765414 RepID=UPI002AAF10B2|nr:hypothetical protein [Paraburkholderia bannensis]
MNFALLPSSLPAFLTSMKHAATTTACSHCTHPRQAATVFALPPALPVYSSASRRAFSKPA